MAEKKQSLLALIEILKKHSDENHALSIKDIQWISPFIQVSQLVLH